MRLRHIWRPRVEMGFCSWTISSSIIINICFMHSSLSQPFWNNSSTLFHSELPTGQFLPPKNHGRFPHGLKDPIYVSVVFVLHADSSPPVCVSVILFIVSSLFSNVPQMEMSKQDDRGAEDDANQTSVSQGEVVERAHLFPSIVLCLQPLPPHIIHQLPPSLNFLFNLFQRHGWIVTGRCDCLWLRLSLNKSPRHNWARK